MTEEVERKVERTVFHWKVKEFSSLDDSLDRYCSAPFSSCGRTWLLSLYRNGVTWNQPDGFIVLYLRACYIDPPRQVRYTLGIRTAKGGTEVCHRSTKTFGNDSYAQIRVIERSELLRRRKELLPQDVLTFTLELKLKDGSFETVLKNAPLQETVKSNVADASVQATVESNVADVSVQTALENSVSCGGKCEPSEKTGHKKIVEDVGKLWPNGDHTDVLLKVKDGEFKAHKTILAARTPVLGAMFQHNTIEKASGEVSIEDCEPKVFEQLLYYIYRGAPRELTAENASALYVLADKYLVNEVKAMCVRCMRDTLCLDTFCDTLTLALMHREDELLNLATDFLSRNMVNVMKSVQWQKFMHQHTTWANEILICAAQLTEARYEGKKDLL